MNRRPEPELMDLPHEVAAYAEADFREVNTRFVARALELAGNERSLLRVLDVGCGPGDIPIALALARPTWGVVGIDAAEPMLCVARERAAASGAANITFAALDAKSLDASLGTFDLVTSNSLLHHLPEPGGLWRSIRRVSRLGTMLFLRDLARPADDAAVERIVAEQTADASPTLRDEYQRSLLAAFTPAEVEKQLVTAGLRGLSVAMSSDRHLDVWGLLQFD